MGYNFFPRNEIIGSKDMNDFKSLIKLSIYFL